MLEIIFLVAGVFIGWHFPQPAWVKPIIDKIWALIKSQVTK